MALNKWDRRFLNLAKFIAQEWSKDPSTQVGAVLVSPDRKQVILGYNGFPRGIDDDDFRLHDRESKYKLIIHAEENALLNAQRSVVGFTMYTWPLPCCDRCALKIVQAGIRRVVAAEPPPERWRDACRVGSAILAEAGVLYDVGP